MTCTYFQFEGIHDKSRLLKKSFVEVVVGETTCPRPTSFPTVEWIVHSVLKRTDTDRATQ